MLTRPLSLGGFCSPSTRFVAAQGALSLPISLHILIDSHTQDRYSVQSAYNTALLLGRGPLLDHGSLG